MCIITTATTTKPSLTTQQQNHPYNLVGVAEKSELIVLVSFRNRTRVPLLLESEKQLLRCHILKVLRKPTGSLSDALS
jgi:hypothetical protein